VEVADAECLETADALALLSLVAGVGLGSRAREVERTDVGDDDEGAGEVAPGI
jgi:hypothetical protein